MNLETTLLAYIMGGTLIALILWVGFGQITVRKLRKNPKTKDELGMEFASGWDILNVAQALSLPKQVVRRLEKSPLSSVFLANTDTLYRCTTRFDRVLARLFFYLFYTSALSMLVLMTLSYAGLFE